MLWHKAQGAGGAGGDITGAFIQLAEGSTVPLPATLQAGDLLIAHLGHYAFANYLNSAFTNVVSHASGMWYYPYYESSAIGYRIATGSEGTSIAVGNNNAALSIYRFSSPVTSVTVAFTATQSGASNRSIDISTYDKPNIVICSVGSNGDPSLTMTASNYAYRSGYLDTAASITNVDSATTTSVISGNNVNFSPAACYAVLVPNF